MRFLRIFLLLVVTVFAGGCASLGYYSQAVVGQLDILARTHPIAELLDDTPVAGTETHGVAPPLAPAVKTRLATVLRVRDFATQALGLPDNGSYRVYADIDRTQVAWNVLATPEFSLTPKEWCFPVAGCVPYRGYFSRKRAQQFAEALKQERLDVRVAGVAAYSTLGWFSDPVFSTQLRRSDADIAALIFHELAHQKLYLRGDAAFNESFATAVEIEGMRRWLVQDNGTATLDNYLHDRTRQAEFVELVLKFRARLELLYASSLQDGAKDGVGTAPGTEEIDRIGNTQSRPRREPAVEESMRVAKARVFEALRAEYVLLRKQWGGYDGYDTWFTQGINNAHMASVDLYHQHVPAFQRLLASVHGDLPAFYRLARVLSRLPKAERAARLAEINDTQTRLITEK
jgi:predicted aminopeptidase